MLEVELKANTEALKALAVAITANTAALGKGGGTTAAGGKTTTGKTETKVKPKHSYDQVKAALSEVKTTIDTEAARAIINGAGGSENLAALANKPENFDAVVAECKSVIENYQPEEAATGDEDL